MKKNWKFRTGIFLVILSTILFLSIAALPFLDFSGKSKLTLTTVAVVLGEITFWAGGILLGKELFNKYKSRLNPFNWMKKKTIQVTTEDFGEIHSIKHTGTE